MNTKPIYSTLFLSFFVCFLQNRGIIAFAITLIISSRVDAVEIIQAEYDRGQLLLVRNEDKDEWKALDIENDKYYYTTTNNDNANHDICRESCDKSRELDALDCYRTQFDYHGLCENMLYNPPTEDPEIQQSERPITNGGGSYHAWLLKIRVFARKTFPTGIFQTEFFSKLEWFEIPKIGISEFHKSALYGANALQRFDLSQNALTELPSMAFVFAGNLTTIDLSYNQIARMPSDVFAEITAQDADYWSTTENWTFRRLRSSSPAKNTFRPLDNLRFIHLNNNHLTVIDPNWFRNLKNLKSVYLNDNLLTEFDALSSFGSNYALRKLFLQNNYFSNINTKGFGADLHWFDISNNTGNAGTQKIDVNAENIDIRFTNSRECFIPYNAAIFSADHNQIRSVIVNGASTTNLTHLYLGHNQINSADFLHGLRGLKEIHLSHNQLTQMSGNVLENMVGLERLDLSHNKFASIDFAFVEPASNLLYLDISNNFLSGKFRLNVEAQQLTELNIANNSFTSVHLNLRKQAPNLDQITLHGNNFDCDELTSMILFLNFDHIKTFTPNEETFNIKYEDNVKGIECHNRGIGSELVDDRFSQHSPKSSYTVLKNDMNEAFDEKLSKLESRLIELFKNVTSSKP